MKYEDVIAYIIRYGLGGALVAVLLAATLSLSGCKTQVVTVPQIQKEYIHDTISRTDSIYRSRLVYMEGDTVHQTDTLLVFRYRDKVQEVVRIDSIPYPIEVVKTVPRKRSGYDRFCSWWFWITAFLLLVKLAAWIMEKFPATAPYIIIIRRFVPFL